MAPRTLAGLSTVLASVGNVAEALNALSQDVLEHDRNGSIVLFIYDARRDLLAERLIPAHEGMRTAQLEIALDHLPTAIRRTISAGRQFADLGPESGDYQKLLGVGASPEAGVLLLRGLLVDGELSGVIGLSEPKTRFGHRLSEKVAPAVDLFALAFARLAERKAREEAVRTLEELTRALNDEHSRALQDLQRKLAEAQSALNGKGTGDSIRVSQLKRAIEVAAVEARATAERLSAVEEQVRVAVTKLEKAHVQLHAQGEALQIQSNIIYRVEQALRQASSHGGDSRKALEEVLHIVTSKEEASSL
jgi:tetratricopeptide (TPR) repeat protein